MARPMSARRPAAAPSSGATQTQAAPARRLILAKIHVAKKQMALTDDSYRDLLRRVTGRDSAADCAASQLDDVLREFKRLGWTGKHRPASKEAIVRMIQGVWRDIAPHLAQPGEAALRAFVQRQTKSPSRPDGVTAPEFLDVKDATRVLEGLKAWRTRLRRSPAAGEP